MYRRDGRALAAAVGGHCSLPIHGLATSVFKRHVLRSRWIGIANIGAEVERRLIQTDLCRRGAAVDAIGEC